MSVIPPALAYFKDPTEILAMIEPYMEQVKPICTPIESLLAAWFIAYAAHMIGLFSSALATGAVDNVDPRKAKSEAAAKKGIFGYMTAFAMSAHNNRLEGFALYAPAVVLCIMMKVEENLLAKLCTLYIVTSAAYVAVYVVQAFFPKLLSAPVSIVRTVIWFSNTIIACVLIKLAASEKTKE
mmetsp:Transcript_26463/g.51264  ORF Transcript_26463/g.51264 Transcript_26463/m.51264 type:complete len:182 (+) Transcript_26463:44-589(+)|eukprot:CAMPEP_0167801128 /NCGR_PEP_ID=MMETSP0111_2-20121227/18216_1 /TAXON_ID=91324 /ORGANISM="Lotharella globosa, Strain CCCM811" /LENGTH=181 /DNA_ID=CAMNT_0007696667 /DNA_START=13 /DNA_END=558 /DNA_ORIENTATION=+